MKTLFSLVLILISCGIVFSQEIDCDNKQKQLSSAITNSDFAKANEILSETRLKCATKSEVFYLLGIEVLKYNVELAADDKKEAAVLDLVKFYDQYDKNFPDNKNGNLINKATVLYEAKISKENDAYLSFDKAFAKDKFQFKNPNALYTYFSLFKDKYNDKNNNISFSQLLTKYSEVLTVVEKNRNEFPDKEVEFNNAYLAINSLVKNDLTKENVVAYAESNYPSYKENVAWLESTANLLSQKAANSPIFGTIANQLHSLNPTDKSAYHLGNFNLKTRNQSKAVEYFNQSATLSSNKLEKAKTYYTLANILSMTDKSKSKEALKLAMENNPSNGEYYVFLSSLYSNAANECGTTSIEKKAIYQLAKTTINKAAQVEPKFKTTADQFSKKFESPTSQELSSIKKNGNRVAIGCWINETVQF
jgi:tetratricopeptide (TPR) repeat protein